MGIAKRRRAVTRGVVEVEVVERRGNEERGKTKFIFDKDLAVAMVESNEEEAR